MSESTESRRWSWSSLPRSMRFLLLLGQLLGLVAVFHLYKLESPLFMRLVFLCVIGFVIVGVIGV